MRVNIPVNGSILGGEIICEMHSPSQWNFNVAWCPRNPALFSTCSFDGHVSVSSLVGGPQQPQTSTKIADSFPGMELYAQPAPPQQTHSTPVDLRKPPKWLKRPTTARFGVISKSNKNYILFSLVWRQTRDFGEQNHNCLSSNI